MSFSPADFGEISRRQPWISCRTWLDDLDYPFLSATFSTWTVGVMCHIPVCAEWQMVGGVLHSKQVFKRRFPIRPPAAGSSEPPFTNLLARKASSATATPTPLTFLLWSVVLRCALPKLG